MLRRRDLNPGDLFVYLEASHPHMKLGELRYVRGGLTHIPDPSLKAEPSPRNSQWMTQKTLDTPVMKLVPEDE